MWEILSLAISRKLELFDSEILWIQNSTQTIEREHSQNEQMYNVKAHNRVLFFKHLFLVFE